MMQKEAAFQIPKEPWCNFRRLYFYKYSYFNKSKIYEFGGKINRDFNLLMKKILDK